ncbi:MAG: peptidoglycan DD-metalloendopeptidase family protein [Clostridia bacterium]|nr:peptidoglycan DD-metalloendopeptidase family protein [Clostridia bacterium]MDD4386362.1 peptidoglycan DD-metalloendopeptidase family protein [Clostridia bacterium]
MDDFEYDQNEELQDNKPSLYDRAHDIKDKYDSTKNKYDNIKGTVDKAKEYRNKIRNSSQAGKAAAKETGKAAAKETGKAAAKETGKAAAKETGKTAAKEVGKTAAKEVGKTAAKGAVAASGVATAGVGTAVAAAIEVADRLNKIKKAAEKKVNDKIKENTGVDVTITKRIIKVAIIFLPFFFIFLFITVGSVWLASEDTYTDLAAIIQKREKRYAETGKLTKPLLLMSDMQISEIVNKDYDSSAPLLENRDLCYETYLEEKYKKEYDNYMPTQETDPVDKYAVKGGIVKSYLKAERDNFNKVKWNVVALSGTLGSATTIKYDTLLMPDINLYKYSPNATVDQIKNMYVDMLYKNLQMWVIPYALNIASMDNDFGKDVLDNMWHPITVSLYQLDRLTKITTTYYYLYTDVKIDHYVAVSNGKGGVKYVYSYTSYVVSTTATTWISTPTSRYTVTLQRDLNNEFKRAAIKIGPTYDRNQVPYRHVPKATDIQDFYNIIKAKYKIIPISEANPPVEKVIVLDADGKEIITELWDEELLNDGTEIKDYKVSYYSPEKYAKLGRKISRIEWFQDYGFGTNEIFPTKTDDEKYATKLKYKGIAPIEPLIQEYSYSDLDFGFQQITKHLKWLQTNGMTGSGNLSAYFIPEGGFYWPVQAVLGPGKEIDDLITSKFGNRTDPVTGQTGTFHGGIDITHGGIGCFVMLNGKHDPSVSYGPDVLAAQRGIAYIKHNPGGYGDYVIIDHENGYFTLYAHLFSISITEGQTVTQGQKIGVMGTKGHSTGVHLHFEIIEASSINDIFNNANKRDPRLFFNDDGSTILPSYDTLTEFGEQTIGAMCAKAISMANNADILYRQTGRQLVTTISGLDSMTQTDCSAFINSMFKTYLNVNPDANSETILAKGTSGYAENGWKAHVGSYSGDTSILRPGDILYRPGHVGIYVGDGKQVDHGGPGGTDSQTDPSWKGPKYRDVSNTYTKYIRYTNPAATIPINGDSLTAIEPTSIDLTGVLNDPRTIECFRVLLAGEAGTMGNISDVDILTVGSYTNQSQTEALFINKYNNYTYSSSWTSADYQMDRVAVATTVVNRTSGDANKLYNVMTAPYQYVVVSPSAYQANLAKYNSYTADQKASIDSAIRIAIVNSNNSYSLIGTCKNYWSYSAFMNNHSDKTGLYNIAGNLFFTYN